MRKLIWLVLVAVAIYAGYWFFGANRIGAEARRALEQARAQGWGDAQALSVAGFPSRFDLTFDSPVLADPAGRWRWSAPFAQIFALAYAPNRVIAVAPAGQIIEIEGSPLRLDPKDMRASVRVDYATSLPLQEARLSMQAATLSAPDQAAPLLTADALSAAIRLAVPEGAGAEAAQADQTRYRLGAEITDLVLPQALIDRIAPGAGLQRTVTRLHLDAVAGLDAPLDRFAPAAPPRLETLSIADLSLDWEGRTVQMAGDLRLRPDGRPEGVLTIRSAQWRDWIALAGTAGFLRPDEARLAVQLGGLLAASKGGEAVEVPLSFRDGQMALGPLPLGPAPRLR